MPQDESAWLQGTPQIATEDDLHKEWSGGRNGLYFRCHLCGYRFQVGDTWRFVFHPRRSHPLVCAACDGPDVLERWDAMCVEAQTRFWWFTRRDQ